MNSTDYTDFKSTDYTDFKSTDYTDFENTDYTDKLNQCNHKLISEISAKGFTLVEVLVAISIFAIIAGAVITVFNKGIDVWEDTRIRTSFREETLMFLDGLEKELKNHINLYGSKFKIEPAKISFTTVKETIYNVEYAFDNDKRQLYRYKAPYPVFPLLVKPILLLKNVKALDFSCEYPKTEEDTEEEAEQFRFPSVINVDLTISDEKLQSEYRLQRTIDIPAL